MTMEKTISKKISVEDSASKPLVNPTPRDKTLGLEIEIRFYAIEDGDDTEEGEKREILIIYDSSLATSNKNLAKRKFPYINMFDHWGPTLVRRMRDLTVGQFEHLETTSPMNTDQKVAYTRSTLKGAALKKYREVLVACRQLAKELEGDEWNLGKLAGLSADDFWTWAKMDTMGYDKNAYLAIDKCVIFEREIWSELGKCMWRKHRRIYKDHLKYILNDIVKPFCVKILLCAKSIRYMHDLAKYLPPPFMKDKSAETYNYTVGNQEFTVKKTSLN